MNSSFTKLGEPREFQGEHAIAPEASDTKLLAELAAGDAAAFWRAWDRYKTNLHQLCLRGCNGNGADAEDALSQVMLKARATLPASAAKIKNLEAWLHRLARNLCIDLGRQRDRKRDVVERWNLTSETESPASEAILSAETGDELRRAIAALPERLREAFSLHVVQEISVPEVAVRLGIQPANVRKRVQLARASLRRAIEHGRRGPAPRVLPETPLRLPRQTWEIRCSAACVRSVRVKLTCGVEQLFHVFSAKSPFSLERKIKLLQKCMRQSPASQDKLQELADLCYLNGDWSGAVALWRRAVSMSPDLPSFLKLGATLLRLGENAVAAGVFKTARRMSFKSAATARHLDGWIALCEADGIRALVEFQAAVSLEPDNPVHLHALVQAGYLAGRRAVARRALQQSLDLNPDDLIALSLGHEIWVATGEIEEAARRAQHLLTLAPRDLLTRRRVVDLRCRLRLVHGSPGLETTRLLRSAQRLSQNRFLIHETLAAFFFAQGKTEKALAIHRDFVEAHPQCSRGREIYARLLAAAKPAELPPENLDLIHSSLPHQCRGIRLCSLLGD